jgi:hypothetical protein
MFLEKFAQFTLRSRLTAIALALLFAPLPFLSWVSAVIVGLVVLRKGMGEGFLVLLWSTLPVVVLAFFSHSWLLLSTRVLLGGLLVWMMAGLFRRAANWLLLINFTVVFGIICVLLFHLVTGDAHAWWLHFLTQFTTQLEKSAGVTEKLATQKVMIARLAYFATGLNIALASFFAIIEMIFARMLDLKLPKALHKKANEQRKIILPRWQIAVVGVFFILAVIHPNVFLDLLIVVLLPCFVAGGSLIYELLKQRSPLWMMVFYIILMVVLFIVPPILGVIAVAAMVDSFVDFRSRFKSQTIKE